MDPVLIIVIVVSAVVLLPVLVVIVMYNRLVNIRQLCKESFADIDTELQRRHDLIPNLVNIVKGYAKHERELFERITELRGKAVQALAGSGAMRGSRGAQRALVSDERELGMLMGNVLAMVENYPALKADAQFQKLMRELTNTEDRIQAARRFYNANVRELNNRCEQFPSNMVAGMFKFEGREFFEVENALARQNVDMKGQF